jgi:hypothetical protein
MLKAPTLLNSRPATSRGGLGPAENVDLLEHDHVGSFCRYFLVLVLLGGVVLHFTMKL